MPFDDRTGKRIKGKSQGKPEREYARDNYLEGGAVADR